MWRADGTVLLHFIGGLDKHSGFWYSAGFQNQSHTDTESPLGESKGICRSLTEGSALLTPVLFKGQLITKCLWAVRGWLALMFQLDLEPLLLHMGGLSHTCHSCRLFSGRWSGLPQEALWWWWWWGGDSLTRTLLLPLQPCPAQHTLSHF